jgi:hypothetical protein
MQNPIIKEKCNLKMKADANLRLDRKKAISEPKLIHEFTNSQDSGRKRGTAILPHNNPCLLLLLAQWTQLLAELNKKIRAEIAQ